jgi:long-chain acyl-CoA synthetase
MNPPALTLDHRGLVVRPAPNPAPQGPFTTAGLLNYGLAHHPERLALVHDKIEYSWQALAARAEAAAGGLASLGIRPGDRVVARIANGPALVEAFLATQQLGALWLGINPNLSDDEACWMMDDARASLVLTDPDRPVGNRPNLNLSEWQDLLAAGHPAPETLIDPHAPAAIAYTSGTTGRPKGAVHSQHNLLWPGVSTRTLYPPLSNERNGTALALTVLNMMILGPISAFVRGTATVILTLAQPPASPKP